MNHGEYLLRITYRGMCFGVDATDGVVTGAAPVAKWMVGKTATWAVDYWHRRGAKVQWMRWPGGGWISDD